MRRPLALLVVFLTAVGPRLAAGPSSSSPPPDYAQSGTPDAAKGRAILEQLRQSGFAAGSYFLTFDLREMPRRGDEQVFQGRIWGGRNEIGPIMRIELTDGTGQEHRFLVQDGAEPSVWSCAGGRVARVEERAAMEPLMTGVEISPFDLQMPFFYWPDAILTGINRIRGRPAYAFLFRPPAGFKAVHPEIVAVRAWLDTAFPEPVQTELIGPNRAVLKTLSLLDIKKIQGQWMLSSADVRTEATRNKTRFSLTGAALGLDLDAALFSPAKLAEEAGVPAESRIESIAP